MQKKILLAEEDESVRKMISRVLESAGYAVTQAGTGEQAAARFRAERPDLVVWDLELPVTSAQPEPLGDSVPVVATTAWPAADAKGVPRGIIALLEKPLDLHLLLKTIQDLLVPREPGRVERLVPAA